MINNHYILFTKDNYAYVDYSEVVKDMGHDTS